MSIKDLSSGDLYVRVEKKYEKVYFQKLHCMLYAQ